MNIAYEAIFFIAITWVSPTTATAAPAPTAAPGAQQVVVPGLRQPVEVLTDRWGVPHLYAEHTDDLFFAQGYIAARERLFQLDLWRRRGLGRLAQALGPSFVEQDRAARLFLYRGDMAQEWRSYGDGAQRIAERFTAGINAFIDQTREDPSRLPLEFKLLRYRPEHWDASDVVRIRSHGLFRNLQSEVARAHVACKAHLGVDSLRQLLEPPWQTQLPEGLDPCLPADVLHTYQLATQAARLPEGLRIPGERTADPSQRAQMQSLPADDIAPMEGSNAWVVAPSRTSTGRPILASDPHRALTAPSLRMVMHLSAPGLDVIGAGEPALPGISIGHNGRVAFGLTIFAIDQEDLYVYQLNPANPNQYRYQGGWEDFRKVTEPVLVRGSDTTVVSLQFSRHGPVIHTDLARGRAYGVRAAWLEPGMAPYFGSLRYLQARDFGAFKASMRTWGAPAENQVYADTAGNIGWVPGGRSPIRTNWDGLLPVPGDGRFEWAGYLDGDLLPSRFNPTEGWLATANEMNLPRTFDYRQHKPGFEWAGSDRYQRLRQVLQAQSRHSLEDAQRLQLDEVSLFAQRLLALLAPLQSTDARAQAALQFLRGWNGEESADSPQAAFLEVWWSRVLAPIFPYAVLNRAEVAALRAVDGSAVLQALENPAQRFGPQGAERRDRLLLETLAQAWAYMVQLLGPDPQQWQWGRLHHTVFTHAAAAVANTATAAALQVGPVPRGGGPATPNVSSYDPRNFRQAGGASFRMVLDVGEWDNSVAINAPGQSGNPDSPHYRDLVELWRSGRYFPLLYSRAAVEKAAQSRLMLTPSGASQGTRGK